MHHAAPLRRFSVPRAWAGLGALLLALAAGPAHADDYADVKRLQAQGQGAQALAKADAYIAAKPRDPQMRFLRGVILGEQGKQTEATEAFTQLTQDFPELPEPYNNLAALYAAQKQFDKARAALETAIKLKPNYATAHENLGDVYLRLAMQSYGRTQQLEPANGSVGPKLAALREVISPKAAPSRAPSSPTKP